MIFFSDKAAQLLVEAARARGGRTVSAARAASTKSCVILSEAKIIQGGVPMTLASVATRAVHPAEGLEARLEQARLHDRDL